MTARANVSGVPKTSGTDWSFAGELIILEADLL